MEVVLVYPHQLFRSHPAMREKACVLCLEEPLFFGCDRQWPMRMHKQKLLLHRASMTAWAEAARNDGHKVIHVKIDNKEGSGIELLENHLPKKTKKSSFVIPAMM